MNLATIGSSSSDIAILILFFVLAGVIGVAVYFYTKKRRKQEASIKKSLNNPLVQRIPVKIMKKRGDSVQIEKLTGKITKIEKESEGKALILDKDRRLDNFDFTKINTDGEVILIEKADGQIVYADLDNDKLTTTGEGLLRDGYFLNQNFIDNSFPIKENKWKVWLPVIVIIFSLVSVLVSLGLTYKYVSGLNKERSKSEEVYAETIQNAVNSLERVIRTVEISVETQEKISEHYREIVRELQNLPSGD